MTITKFENQTATYLEPKSASSYAESLRVVKDRFLVRVLPSEKVTADLLRDYLWESFASKFFKSPEITWDVPVKKKADFFKGIMVSPLAHVVFRKINNYSLRIETLSENIYAETIYTVSDEKKGAYHILITPSQWLKDSVTIVYARMNQRKFKKSGRNRARLLAKQISNKFGVNAVSVQNIFARYLRKTV